MAKKPKAKKKSFTEQYPVLETIGNVRIRQVNYLHMYISRQNMVKIAKIILKAPELSAAKILAISGAPCECCKEKKIFLQINGDRVVMIPRGLLSVKRGNNGGTISTKKHCGI